MQNTETNDRENALINLYVFFKINNGFLPDEANTVVFLELSEQRDPVGGSPL